MKKHEPCVATVLIRTNGKRDKFELAFFTFELMFIKCGTKWNLPAIQTKALRRRFPAKENGQKQIRNI
jgi:hypothetical protein